MAFVAPLALAFTAIGSGISAFSQFRAASQQRQLADYNYKIQQQNAQAALMASKAQAAIMQQQASVMERQAEINNALAQSQAQGRDNNAISLRNQSEAQSRASEENIRRTRTDMDRITATQRAKIAGSGVVESGSPLELLADQAGEMQQALNEQHYQADVARRQKYGEAGFEEFSGKMIRAGAEGDLWAGKAQADIQRSSAALEAAKGRSQYQMGLRQASFDREAGYSNSKGSMLAGFGSLFNSFGGIGQQWNSWKYKGAI